MGVPPTEAKKHGYGIRMIDMSKIIRLTPGKLADITAVAMLLSFMLGISFVNMGGFPYEETVELENLIASVMYVFFIILFIYFSAFFQRKRLIVFNAVIFTVALLFSVWYFAATLTTKFIPSSTSGIFSLFTYAFHTQFIGIYYLIKPIDRVVYGTWAFIFSFIIAALSWFLLLRRYGYFDSLFKVLPKREKRERLSRIEKMRREIKAGRSVSATDAESKGKSIGGGRGENG